MFNEFVALKIISCEQSEMKEYYIYTEIKILFDGEEVVLVFYGERKMRERNVCVVKWEFMNITLHLHP